MLTYCGIIPEGQIVTVIGGNITEYIANKIEEIITIYSYDSDEEQYFAKTFLKNDSYRYLCTFLNKIHKVPKKIIEYVNIAVKIKKIQVLKMIRI